MPSDPKHQPVDKRVGVKAETAPARKLKAPYLGGLTNEAQKPWLALGLSRATWYRRQKEEKK
jgi:hypothetical protein